MGNDLREVKRAIDELFDHLLQRGYDCLDRDLLLQVSESIPGLRAATQPEKVEVIISFVALKKHAFDK